MYLSSSGLFNFSDLEARAAVEIPHGFEVGLIVEVPVAQGLPRYGVIKWIGILPDITDKLVAGLELVKTAVLCLAFSNHYYSPKIFFPFLIGL